MADDLIEAIDKHVSLVRTQSLDFSFNELADMYTDGELTIQPEFQRMFRWSTGAQSRFIESLLLELPIPPIFLLETDNREYELIDGLQRVSSYLHFRGVLRTPEGDVHPPLVLEDCDIVRELNGMTFTDLPRALDIKVKRGYVRAEILRRESDNHLRYHMFKRLNTGGLRLSEQEVRNATIRLLSNDFNEFITRLSVGQDFVYCIDTVADGQMNRRFDQELVLRFFAFKNNGPAYKHEVSEFLTEYMEAVSDPADETSFDYATEELLFEKTFAVLAKIDQQLAYEGRIFGTVGGGSRIPRGQFSVYHYEGLTLGIQAVIDKIDPEDTADIETLSAVVAEGKIDTDFLRHTGAGKNDRVPLAARIRYFSDAFSAALQ